MHGKIFICVIISLLSIWIIGCNRGERAKEISLEKKEPVELKTKQSEGDVIKIAVGSMIMPKAGYVYYRQLLDYLEKKLNKPVRLIDRNSYSEVNNELKAQHIDIAFVCGGPYVDGHDTFGLELLAAPQVNGMTVYYSYIIVPRDSPINDLKGLRDKFFAFTDPMSNTGKLVPTYMLFRIGETPDSFFKQYIYTSAHDKSIEAVAQNIVDGAAVDSLIYEYLNYTNPELISKTRVIVKSPPYGIPPVVVRHGLAPELKEGIRQILLSIHNDPEGKKILNSMMIERFVMVNDTIYNSIREMERALSGRK